MKTGGGLCHGIGFCRWGSIRFGRSQGKYIVVRERDGAVPTEFNWGRAHIPTFRRPEQALLHFIEHRSKDRRRGLNAKSVVLVRLLDIHYWTSRPTKCDLFRPVDLKKTSFCFNDRERDERKVLLKLDRKLATEVRCYEYWGGKKKCWFANSEPPRRKR
jgi:hypothetical protein